MPHQIDPNLETLRDSLSLKKRGVILEGSSRSGKTWAGIFFIVYVCTRLERNATINIIKETHRSFNTTLYEDFNRVFPMLGLPAPFARTKEVVNFKLLGNKINFLGADSESVYHGVGSDYFWINEALDVSEKVFDQSEMRCRKFWWFDYNPKVTDHWVFNSVEPRDDTIFLKTTFMDNPHISEPERNKILSYDPSNPKNVKQGTADDYLWQVYGLGNRAAPEGLIFPYVDFISIDEFEKQKKKAETIRHGLDFGYTNSPSALAEWFTIGTDLYADCPFYEPTKSFNELEPLLMNTCKKDDRIIADPSGESGGRGFISQARRAGWLVIAANTFPGSIKHGLSILNRYKLKLVDRPHIKKEQSNYKFREIQGIRLDEPIDDFNHFWDALRISAMTYIR